MGARSNPEPEATAGCALSGRRSAGAGGRTAAARVGLGGGSVCEPEAAPAGPSRPRPGFLANRYSASAERAPSARTERGAGPTRRPLPLPL